MARLLSQFCPKPLRKIRGAIAGVALVTLASVAIAGPVQLVQNGEFEIVNNVVVSPDNWYRVSNGNLPGWSTTYTEFEIWGGNFINTANGSDGLPHGRNLELSVDSTQDVISQSIIVAKNGSVDFSFDAWRRAGSGVLWSLTSNKGLSLGGTFSLGDDNWHALTARQFDVAANEVLKMTFQSVGGGSSGAHIDQVSMLFNEQVANNVPEPQSLGLLFAGLGMMGFVSRRRRQK